MRSVVLTVYYAPLDDFGLPLALELAKLWAERYPAITQEALRPRPPEVPPASPFDGTAWPFPRVVQTDNTLSRSISYQFDQFSLRWTFDGGVQANRYPGFDALFLELQTVYKQFAELVDRLSGSSISIQACGCEYLNNFDEVSPESWFAGYVSNWKATIPTDVISSGDEKAFLRFSGTSTNADVEQKYSIQVSRRKVRGSSVRIRASALSANEENVKIGEDAVIVKSLMESAHSILISTFERSSSDTMKENWGKHGSASK